MEFDGDVLTIDINMSMEEIIEFEDFIRTRVDYIDIIEVKEEGSFKSSAFLSILSSLKKTKPELQIPFLEKRVAISFHDGVLLQRL